MRDGVEHAERHDAAAGRRVGRDDEAVERADAASASRAHSSVVRRLPAVQTCSAISHSLDDALEVRVRHRGRPAVDVERDVRVHLQQMIAGDRAGARDRRAAGVAGGDQARPPWRRRPAARSRRRSSPRRSRPWRAARPCAASSAKSACLEAGLQDHRAGDDPHAARPIVGEAALRRDRQRLDAFDVARPARHVHLARPRSPW